MAIDYDREIISSGYNLSKINNNFAKIETALVDGISRTGQGPNQMEADLDLNDNDLLNVKTLDVNNITYQGETLAPQELVVSGAMLRSQYDPTNIGGDVFNRANHYGAINGTSVTNVPITANSRTSAAALNLLNASIVLVRRWADNYPSAPLLYFKVAQPANVEPTSPLKFQDVNGLWFEGEGYQYTPDMFGIPMDGTTDAYSLLQLMFDKSAGSVVVFPKGITFLMGSAILSIKANTTVYWGGCTLRRDVSANSYAIEIDGDNVKFFQPLYHTSAGSRGIRIRNSNFSCPDGIWITADTAGTGGGNILQDAIRIDTNGVAYPKNISGKFYVTNFDMGLCSKGCEELDVYVKVRTYRTAVWLRDTNHAWIRGSAKLAGPNNKGNPGENGVLIESTTDNASKDIHIIEFVAEDCGEHGYRVGGQTIVSDVWFERCRSKNTGLADGTGVEPDDHGGCGFKVLGPTSVQTSYHQNINFTDCIVEDIKISTDAEVLADAQNFSGFDIGKVMGCTITNPIVRLSNLAATSGFSSLNGIEVYGSYGVTITNPLIHRPYLDGIYFFENASGGSTFWGDANTIHTVVGGVIDTPGKAGIHIRPINLTFRRISIQGPMVIGGERGLHFEIAGTGSQIQCNAEMICLNQTVETVTGGSAMLLRMAGTFVGSNNAQNGSQFNDTTTGTLRIRKGGAWVSL